MFVYYNNNPFKRHVNDCSVRAIALATNRSWNLTYKELSDYARKEGITFSEVEFINEYLSRRYPRYCEKERDKVVTVGDFSDLKLKGRWLCTMGGHITCVIDGVIYDTFDPSERYLWCAYYVGEENNK